MNFFKNTLLLFFISVSVFAQQNTDFSVAKAGKQVLGVYVFIGCEPVNAYDYIETLNVKWHHGDPDKSLLEIIERGQKKYPNFNAVIFKDAKFETADLIKFRELEINGGGFRINDKVVYKDNGKPKYGHIIQLDNTKQKAGFKYFNEYGEEKLINIAYVKLSMVSAEQYDLNIQAQLEEIQKHKFSIGEKTTWTDDENLNYGEVVNLNSVNHMASVKWINIYGEEKTSSIDFIKLNKIEESKYQAYKEEHNIEIQKYKFNIGQKLSYIDDNLTKYGEVVSLDNKTHIAYIKYFNAFGEEKAANIKYLNLTKVTEEKFQEEFLKQVNEVSKHKFKIAEKVNWSKNSTIIQAEVVSLNDLDHKAIIKYIDKDNLEKQTSVSYLNLFKIE